MTNTLAMDRSPGSSAAHEASPLSLLASGRPLIRWHRGALSSSQLLNRAGALAERLPSGPAALNLCERRDNFLVAFLALLMRGQACLMPPARAPAVLAEVVQENLGCYRLDDAAVEQSWTEIGLQYQVPTIPAERVVAVGYTSGSTGRPKSNAKTWGSFAASTRLNCERLREVALLSNLGALPWIVATVPSQHMYGMEMSVLMPLLGEMGIHAGNPLFPADISAALNDLPEPRVLVTTPLHLRTLVESGIELPRVAAVVSATAPLTQELAQEVERRFDTKLLEFFGSTETCVIASRLTASELAWRAYPGVTLLPEDECTRVIAPWLPEGVLLQDVTRVEGDGRFVISGRNTDMVEVGGKRASLADLTRRLLAVSGVSDAIVFQPGFGGGDGVRRVAALVVADGLTETQLTAKLATAMDPVFLPRPLIFVSQLPRNEVGKLPRDELLAALETWGRHSCQRG